MPNRRRGPSYMIFVGTFLAFHLALASSATAQGSAAKAISWSQPSQSIASSPSMSSAEFLAALRYTSTSGGGEGNPAGVQCGWGTTCLNSTDICVMCGSVNPYHCARPGSVCCNGIVCSPPSSCHFTGSSYACY
jgi:hypothetical protein